MEAGEETSTRDLCSKYKTHCEELEAAQQTHQAKSSAALAEVREHVVNLTEALASMDAMWVTLSKLLCSF